MSEPQANLSKSDSAPGQSRQPPARLAEYRRRQLELGELISAALKLASDRRRDRRHLSPREHSGRELLARLADDRFQLAVIGQFSRGKSTMMNAIMGAPYLPTGALPMTSVLTTVRYGSHPRATVQRRGSRRLPIETTLEQLPRFVAQSSQERDELQVDSAVVELPAEILRLGFQFVDTPGIGSAIAANTATTQSFLPQADALIFVTSFDAALSEAELDFLANATQYVERLFLVVNKLDLVRPQERKDVEQFIRGQLTTLTDGPDPQLFSISARDGLAAKLSRSPQQLADSGLPALERSLVRFLSEEKGHTFLLALAGRAQQLLMRLRFDLSLGRAGSTTGSGASTSPALAFQTRAQALFDQQQTIVDRLVERIATELPHLLAYQADRWPAQLRELASAELQALAREGDPETRERTLETATSLQDALPSRLEPWIAGRVGQTRALLVELAAGELATLDSLERSIERRAADTFAVPLEHATPARWSPSDLPELAIHQPALSIPLHLPAWSSTILVSKRPLHTRLTEALDAGIAGFVAELCDGLAHAAEFWVKTLGSETLRRTREVADHLLANAQTPPADAQLTELDGLQQRLLTFRADVATWESPDDPAPETLESPPAAIATEPVTRCIICEQVASVPFDYMAHAQWELFRHEDRREQHARNGGFCPLHTWQYAETASDAAIALTYTPLARAAAQTLGTHSDHGNPSLPEALSAALADLMPGADRCPACQALADAERAAVQKLVAALAAHPADEPPPPVCVRHLAAIVATDPGGTLAAPLADQLAHTLQRSAQDMQTYSLKRESLRSHLLTDEEHAAFAQALRLLTGRRELARPYREVDEIG